VEDAVGVDGGANPAPLVWTARPWRRSARRHPTAPPHRTRRTAYAESCPSQQGSHQSIERDPTHGAHQAAGARHSTCAHRTNVYLSREIRGLPCGPCACQRGHTRVTAPTISPLGPRRAYRIRRCPDTVGVFVPWPPLPGRPRRSAAGDPFGRRPHWPRWRRASGPLRRISCCPPQLNRSRSHVAAIVGHRDWRRRPEPAPLDHHQFVPSPGGAGHEAGSAGSEERFGLRTSSTAPVRPYTAGTCGLGTRQVLSR
jgi:hypothetical protein